jgi:uncharacterized CHY-type Zn-finger protein
MTTGPIKCSYCGIETEGIIATDRDTLPCICGTCIDKGLRLEDHPLYKQSIADKPLCPDCGQPMARILGSEYKGDSVTCADCDNPFEWTFQDHLNNKY